MRTKKQILICFLYISDSKEIVSTGTGELLIEIDGFKNYNGYIQLNLFNTEQGFPDSDESALKKLRVKVINGENSLSIPNLSFGSYAISVYHDQNSNGKMDTNFFGIPKEPVGISNNVSGGSVPDFQDAKFELNVTKKVVKIHLM